MITQSAAYVSRELSHLHDHSLYKKLQPRTSFLCRLYEQFAAYISQGLCNPRLIAKWIKTYGNGSRALWILRCFRLGNPDFGFHNKTRNPFLDFDDQKPFFNTDFVEQWEVEIRILKSKSGRPIRTHPYFLHGGAFNIFPPPFSLFVPVFIVTSVHNVGIVHLLLGLNPSFTISLVATTNLECFKQVIVKT